jgi:hypothetical protein
LMACYIVYLCISNFSSQVETPPVQLAALWFCGLTFGADQTAF